MQSATATTVGTGTSVVVENCQVCHSAELMPIMFLGYLPPVNTMALIGATPKEEKSYPAQLLSCQKCSLVQLGLIVDPQILFPPDYAYTSGTTRILRENFAELYRECKSFIELKSDDLIVDIGSNDGTLLSNFRDAGHRVKGIEPTLQANLAMERGIFTEHDFFGPDSTARVLRADGQATVVTATNVFAHIENIDQVVDCIDQLLKDGGLFISESHYWMSLAETLQYDTVYHEHLRYYTLHSIKYLLEAHGFEIVHAKKIPTHGGSIRVYAARKGQHLIQPSVAVLLQWEKDTGIDSASLKSFKNKVAQTKLQLLSMLAQLKETPETKIFGVGAPSRASTLISYTGIDENIIDCVLEISGSQKIGKYMPGTLIPVLDESLLYSEQPEYVLLLSWHIADELITNLKTRGYKGKFIVPLPAPVIID